MWTISCSTAELTLNCKGEKLLCFWMVLKYLWLGLIKAALLVINKAVVAEIKTVDEELVVVCYLVDGKTH